MKPLFFGNPNAPLFGVYHPPRANQPGPSRAVLICPPIGQEYIRSHWTIRLVANQLARKGIHVLRFDYAGHGDSAGDVVDVKNLSSWMGDIEMAVNWLKDISGATNVLLVGVRVGALLAQKTVAQIPSEINSVVYWEPVQSGANYLQELRDMHNRMLDLWVCRMETCNDAHSEEILGSIYSRSMLTELENTACVFGDNDFPTLLVQSASQTKTFPNKGLLKANNGLLKAISTEDEYSWNDLTQLETAWLRPKTVRVLVASIDDMFQRLQKFGVLEDQATEPSQFELVSSMQTGGVN